MTGFACAAGRRHAATEPRTFLVWLSIDGLSADYLDRAETPTFDRLMREGAYSRELIPGFPSLTFPSHVSQATGAPVREHGIPMNSFHDRDHGRTYSFPPFANLLQAEPIWTTATRQGVRTVVYDWPLSHRQTGPHAAASFGERYDRRLTDDDRLDRLIQAWQADTNPKNPLRLLMTYGDAPDRIGHAVGPDAPEIAGLIQTVDARLGRFWRQILEQFERIRRPGDRLVFFVTSDHGMSPVHTAVNIDRLAGIEARKDVLALTGGPVAHIYLHQVDESERDAVAEAIRAAVESHPFASVYIPDTLPPRWQMEHPVRGGDLVVLLQPGHTFHRGTPGVSAPAETVGADRGTHGFDPADDPRMASLAIFWITPEPYGGVDLGPIYGLQLHATAAALLGIEPSPRARPDPIPLPGLQPIRTFDAITENPLTREEP